MDKFVTITRHKVLPSLTKSQEEIVSRIRKYVDAKESICVYGKPGIGKTLLVTCALQGYQHVEVIDDSDVPIPESADFRIIISKNTPLENCGTPFHMKPLPSDEMILIAEKFFDGDIEAPNGQYNIREYLTDLEYTKVRDIFKSPKELVCDLLSGDEDPRKYIGVPISEHGYSFGIVHENYLDGCTIENFHRIADWMSLADIQDENIYRGTPGSLFSLFAVVLPAIELNHSLGRDNIRPGSAWTKFNNYKMRYKKYSTMTSRMIGTTVDVDSLELLTRYCKKDPAAAIEKLMWYRFEPSDVDVMNHIVLNDSTKALAAIKKQLTIRYAGGTPASSASSAPAPVTASKRTKGVSGVSKRVKSG